MRDHTGRPRLTSNRRRSWRQFFLGEWGLLLLAAALTFIIWDNVREKVIREHRIGDIRVKLEVIANNVRAVVEGEDKVAIKVECSERERDDIIAQLRADGDGEKSVTIVVRDPPTQQQRPIRAELDKFRWKFDVERVLREVSPVQPFGTVFKTKIQNLTVARPDHDLKDDKTLDVELDWEPKSVPLELPLIALQEDEGLVPDNLALSELISGPDFRYGVPYLRDLTFYGWRAAKPGWRGIYRDGLEIQRVRATIIVHQKGSRSLTNRLLVQLDANNYEYDFDELGFEEPVVKDSDSNWLFTGTLKGRTTVLDALAADAKDKPNWHWAIAITDLTKLPKEPAEGKDSEWVTVDAKIVWVAGATFRDKGVTFVPKASDEGFNLKVRWHPRHPK